jgi:endonuclease/exonuclease/phosphatase family metal-dependent hydrolase
MVRRQAPGDWLAPAAAATTLLLVEVLRVWLPSVTFVFGRAGSTPATTMGLFAAAWFLVPVLVLPVLRRTSTGVAFGVAALTLCAARLVLQATSGGDPQLWAATLGLTAGLVALTALAGGAASGHVARVGVVAGLLLHGVLHLSLGTLDLVWRANWTSVTAVVALVAACAVVILRAASAPGWAPHLPAGVRGPGWPWLLTGPAIAVVMILGTVPARLELASGLTPGVVAGLLAGAHLLGIGLALLGPALGAARLGIPGGIVVLAATAGALQPTGPVAVLAQLALPLGLGAVVGATGQAQGTSTTLRRAGAMAGSWVGFLVVVFLYYAAYDLNLGVSNRVLLLLASAGVAAVGVAATTAAPPPRHPRPLRRAVGGLTAMVVLVGLVAGAGAARTLTPDAPHEETATTTLTAVLANVQMGYDPEGRHTPGAQAQVIDGLDPDVVVVNEVDRGWLLTGGHDNLRLLSSGLRLPHHVFAPAADEVWGNAVLTREPIRQQHTSRLPRVGAPMARSLVTAVIELDEGRELGIVGTHLHHVEDEPEVRLRQVRAVAAEVARLRDRGVAVLVLGDLNAEQAAPELEPLEELLDHAVPAGVPTWPAWDPEVQIDHVLVSDDLEVVRAGVLTAKVSDHLFVAVEVALR